VSTAKRRDFLRAAGAALSGLLVGCREGSNGDSPVLAEQPRILPHGRALRTISALPNTAGIASTFTATLVAAPANAEPLPGRSTEMLLYNGMGPGPLIELREGQHVRITLENRLADDSTIHWHGLPVPSEQDGNPMDPVKPGTTHDYEFDLPAGSAGTYWYHPHPHDLTAQQVACGLAGPLIVRADDDPLADIPEVAMFISGLGLDQDARVARDGPIDWTVGRQVDVLLVNGDRLPVHRMQPGATQRWRIFNATAARHFRLALEGHTFALVGTDGGLLGEPITGLEEVLIGPAQRVEVVVTSNASPNGTYRLRALAFQTDFLGFGTYIDDDLLTVVTTNEPPARPIELPSKLRAISDLGVASATQLVELSEIQDFCTKSGAKVAFLINGQRFDINRVDLTTVVGRVETWEITNRTGMAHPFHIHGTQFQLVSRRVGTVVRPAPYLAWIDTVVIPSQHSATIKVRQSLPGKRMFHCHILEHEDNCMMAILEVLPRQA